MPARTPETEETRATEARQIVAILPSKGVTRFQSENMELILHLHQATSY